jgi:hypothetical protein
VSAKVTEVVAVAMVVPPAVELPELVLIEAALSAAISDRDRSLGPDGPGGQQPSKEWCRS